MKSHITVAALFVTLSVFPCHAEPAKAAPVAPAKNPEKVDPATKTAPSRAGALDVPNVLLKPRQKTTANDRRRKPGRQAQGVTREKGGPIKLVALAPADDGVTIEDQPRLWWWQSDSTKAEELVFKVTKLVADGKDQRRQPVLEVVLVGPRQPGFNWFDLSDPLINKGKLRLEAGAEYNWSVAFLQGEKLDSVEVPIRRVGNAELETQWKMAPLATATLNSLSNSGNWYELFDAVACTAFLNPGNEGWGKLRERLLAQVGLEAALTP